MGVMNKYADDFPEGEGLTPGDHSVVVAQTGSTSLDLNTCFEVQGVLHFKEHQWLPEEIVSWSNPVRVCDSGGKLIGFASLYVEEFLDRMRLTAQAFLYKDIPERLDIEANQRRYYLSADNVIQVNLEEGLADLKVLGIKLLPVEALQTVEAVSLATY